MSLYQPTDATLAAEAHIASCGHAALAAILGREVRDVMTSAGDAFAGRNYVSAPMMENALAILRPGNWRPGLAGGKDLPVYGLALLQFNGPWMAVGLPFGAQLAHTHWIATARSPEQFMVYDINNVGGEWLPRSAWEDTTLQELLRQRNDTTGWYSRRCYEVQPRILSVP